MDDPVPTARRRAVQALAHTVRELPAELAQPFLMVYVQKQTQSAAATALGLTRPVLQDRLCQALVRCREGLEARIGATAFSTLLPPIPDYRSVSTVELPPE